MNHLILFPLALCLAGILPCAQNAGTPQNPYTAILTAQHARYPQMQARDVYKLVMQASFGSEHLGADSTKLARYLQWELDQVSPDSTEPLIEGIAPGDSVVRLNLRRFKADRGDIDAFIRGMLASMRSFKKSPEKFERFWSAALALAQTGGLPIHPDTLRTFGDAMRRAGYPAVHHSAAYENAYHPAYRVLLRDCIPATKGTRKD